MNHSFITTGVKALQIRFWYSASMTDRVLRFTLDLKSHWLKEIQGLDIQLIISISKVARYNGVSLLYARSFAKSVFLEPDTQEKVKIPKPWGTVELRNYSGPLQAWHAGYPVNEPCETRAIVDMRGNLWLWLYILMVPMDSEKLSWALWQFL